VPDAAHTVCRDLGHPTSTRSFHPNNEELPEAFT